MTVEERREKARAAGTTFSVFDQTHVNVVVAGEPGTGKSTLIKTAATSRFHGCVDRVLPETELPINFHGDADPVPVRISDTSSRPEDANDVDVALRKAHVVVLTYACDQTDTLQILNNFWLPKLAHLDVNVPVLVVGCKSDVSSSVRKFSSFQKFTQIEDFLDCSALEVGSVLEVFCSAQQAVLHPTAPLLDLTKRAMRPKLGPALRRIFLLCDHDKDNLLSDDELDLFQLKCFKKVIRHDTTKMFEERFTEGALEEGGFTLKGFVLFLFLFLDEGQFSLFWTILREFGYNNDLEIADDLIPSTIRETDPNQSHHVELSNKAIEFLSWTFSLYDHDTDGLLEPNELEDLFCTAPENPFSKAPYKDAAETNASGGLSLHSFLSLWALMTHLDPTLSMKNLSYIGFDGDLSSAICVTGKRTKQYPKRNVLQCLVFSLSQSRKFALLDCFLGRPSSPLPGTDTDTAASTADNERYAVNNVVVDQSKGTKKTLVLREIPAGYRVGELLSSGESLAACDVVVFVCDSSDYAAMESSKQASKMLVDVFDVPCLFVTPYCDPIEFATISQDIGQQAGHMVVPVSTKLGDVNNLFCEILNAARNLPLMSLSTSVRAKRRSKQHVEGLTINRSLIFGLTVASTAAVAYMLLRQRR